MEIRPEANEVPNPMIQSAIPVSVHQGIVTPVATAIRDSSADYEQQQADRADLEAHNPHAKANPIADDNRVLSANIEHLMKAENLRIHFLTRPDIDSAVFALSKYQNQGLVYACGPAALVDECLKASQKYTVDFHCESFEL